MQPSHTHQPSSGNDSPNAISIHNVDYASCSDTLGIQGTIGISTAGDVEQISGYMNSEVSLRGLTAFASITCNRASCRLNPQMRNMPWNIPAKRAYKRH